MSNFYPPNETAVLRCKLANVDVLRVFPVRDRSADVMFSFVREYETGERRVRASSDDVRAFGKYLIKLADQLDEEASF